MKLVHKIKKLLIGTGFEVGERVFWNNPCHADFSGEYVVTSKRDKQGLVGVYNEKKQDRLVRWFELEPLD